MVGAVFAAGSGANFCSGQNAADAGFDFIPFSVSPEKYEGKIKKLPTGAAEFDVDLPAPKSEVVVNAADFIKPDSKTVKSDINRALEHCKKIGASKLVFPKRRYYITEDWPINIHGFKDFTFDGNGSTFVFYKKRGCNFSVESCERVRLTNFNVDWDWNKDPIGSIVQVENTGTDENGMFVDIRFVDYEDFPKKDVRFVLFTPWVRELNSVGVEDMPEYNFNNNSGANNPKFKWLSPNSLRVSVRALERFFKKGGYYRLVHYSYDMGNMQMTSNRHLTLDGINVWSCPGFGFGIHGSQQYWKFKNVNMVLPKGDKRRCITSSADHCHLTNSLGYFIMEGCEISYGADDCINMHDCSAFGRKRGEKSLIGRRLGNYISKGDKIELRHGDFSPTEVVATVLERKLADPSKKPNWNSDWILELDKTVPDAKVDGFVLFNKKYNTSNIIVRDCYFHDNRARGILILAKNVSVENCKFRRNQGAGIKIETGYTYKLWSEGFGADNIKISGNTFDTVNPMGTKNQGYERDIFIGTYAKTDPSPHSPYPILSNILIENNTFIDTFGLAVYAASVKNLIVRDNVFIAKTARGNVRDYRGCFRLQDARNVKIINNRYKASEFFKDLGVIYNPATVKKLTVSGNVKND